MVTALTVLRLCEGKFLVWPPIRPTSFDFLEIAMWITLDIFPIENISVGRTSMGSCRLTRLPSSARVPPDPGPSAQARQTS